MNTKKIAWDCSSCGLGFDVTMTELLHNYFAGEAECPNCGGFDYIDFKTYKNRQEFVDEVPF